MGFLSKLSTDIMDNFGVIVDRVSFDDGGISYKNKIIGISAEHSPDGYLVVAVTASPDMDGFEKSAKQDSTMRVQEFLETNGYGSCDVRPFPRANILVCGKIDSGRLVEEVQPRVLRNLPYNASP